MDKIISVIIPTYNRQYLTDQAIVSVKSRTPDLVEIIVVDDCGTEPYNYSSQSNSDGIIVHTQRTIHNGGAGFARREGIDTAKGELIAFLDSDDKYSATWLDIIIQDYTSQNKHIKEAVIYVGQVSGWRMSHKLVWQFINKISNDRLRLIMTRIITVFFNPFYTPSIAMSKSIANVSEKLRYCEDYYTMALAIFKVNKIIFLSELACLLGHNPNSTGGLSAARREMFNGEMSVRIEILKMKIPIFYKFLALFGIVYQILRTIIKIVFKVK